MMKSPTEIYINGDWYVILSLWIKKVNDIARINYDSATPELRSKENLKSVVFSSGLIFEEKNKMVTKKPVSSLEIVELGEVLNRQNKKR